MALDRFPAPNPGEAVQALAGDGAPARAVHCARRVPVGIRGACSNGNALASIIAGSIVLIARDEGPEECAQCAQPRRRPLPMLRLRPQSHSRDPRLTWASRQPISAQGVNAASTDGRCQTDEPDELAAGPDLDGPQTVAVAFKLFAAPIHHRVGLVGGQQRGEMLHRQGRMCPRFLLRPPRQFR